MHLALCPWLSTAGMRTSSGKTFQFGQAACRKREFLGPTPAFELVLPPESAGSIRERLGVNEFYG